MTDCNSQAGLSVYSLLGLGLSRLHFQLRKLRHNGNWESVMSGGQAGVVTVRHLES